MGTLLPPAWQVRTVKNRYGATDEVGVFQMHDDGMQVGRKGGSCQRLYCGA